MQVKVDKNDVLISFEKDFSDVIEHLGSKKGIIQSSVPYLYNGVWTNLLYEIAYYELDLEHVYSLIELDELVKRGKIILLSSRPYICVKENSSTRKEDQYATQNLTTLEEYNSYNINWNSKENNRLVLEMLRKHNEEVAKRCEKLMIKK